jgi:two-component system, NarL family, response regulator NreC
MEKILLNSKQKSTGQIPTMIIAMPDLMCGEMISEWQFNCNFRSLAVMDNGREILKRVQSLKPDFLFVDTEMPNFNGFEFAEKLKSQSLSTKIILYASKRFPDYLTKFLDGSNHRIRGFIHKGCGVEELERCLIEVFAGGKYLSNCIGEYLNEVDIKVSQNDIDVKLYSQLGNREREVWQYLTKGKTEREIGLKMSISIATVKTYKKRIKEKLDLTGKGKLTYIALNNSIN